MTTRKRLRAALYGRVSLDRLNNSRSPGQQQSAGEEVCADDGWEVAGVYTDGGVGASRLSKKARADWARLLADITAGRIDVVIVWEWSRADRNPTTGMPFLDLCRDHGVLIHVVIDERTYNVAKRPKDWADLAHALVDNAMEVERTSQRSKRDRAARVEQGIVDGRWAYGYEREYDPRTREFIRQVVHPQHGPIVREIITRVIAGEALSAIAESLTQRGVPTPAGGVKWHRSVVRGIAVNPAYISRRLVDGKLWPVDWPAIVSDAEHYAAVRLLSDPSRTTTRPGRAVWLLSYIGTCAECGSVLNTMTRGAVPRKMYVCQARQCAAIQVTELDEKVAVALCRYLAQPHVFKALTRVDDSAANAVRDELSRLEAELKEWQNAAGTGVSLAAVAAAERNLTPQIDAAKARLAAMSTASGAVRALLGDKRHSYEELRERFGTLLSVAQRREIVRELLTVKVASVKRMREPGVGVVGEPKPRIQIAPR